MNDIREKVVYDCNVHLQFLMNPNGPAGECVRAALDKKVDLIISEYLLTELREMPARPSPMKFGVTSEKVEAFINHLVSCCTLVTVVPTLFSHPIDPDDSHYINLALAMNANLIVSRDRHLLGLMDPAKSWSEDFRSQFPALKIMTAESFLQILRQSQ